MAIMKQKPPQSDKKNTPGEKQKLWLWNPMECARDIVMSYSAVCKIPRQSITGMNAEPHSRWENPHRINYSKCMNASHAQG